MESKTGLSSINIHVTDDERAMIRRVSKALGVSQRQAFVDLFDTRAKELKRKGQLLDDRPDRRERSGVTFWMKKEDRHQYKCVAASDNRPLLFEVLHLFQECERDLIAQGKLEPRNG